MSRSWVVAAKEQSPGSRKRLGTKKSEPCERFGATGEASATLAALRKHTKRAGQMVRSFRFGVEDGGQYRVAGWTSFSELLRETSVGGSGLG